MVEEEEQEINNKVFFREWLEKLQQESWQLELIISGFALYGIYNCKEYVNDFEYLQSVKELNNIFFDSLDILLTTGWKIFFINLLFHVILRSLWIGAIGLRYVSGEIDYKKLNYSAYFNDYFIRRVGDYDDFIERLEKICSVLFSYTFLLFLFFMSIVFFGIFLTLPLAIFDWMGMDRFKSALYWMIWFFPYCIFGFFVFLDFITLGGFRRIKDRTVSKMYMPIFKFYSFVTLSFLYRPLLYNFIDDKYTKRLFFFSLPYIFLIVWSESIFVKSNTPHIAENSELIQEGNFVNERYYEDLFFHRMGREQGLHSQKGLLYPRLLKYKIDDGFLSFIVKSRSRDLEILEKTENIIPKIEPGWNFSLFNKVDDPKDSRRDSIGEAFDKKIEPLDKQYRLLSDSLKKKKVNEANVGKVELERDKLRSERRKMNLAKTDAIKNFESDKNNLNLMALQRLLNIKIDSIDYNDSLSCHYYFNAATKEKGMICNIDVMPLKRGHHNIMISQIRNYDKKLDSLYTWHYDLPFIKLN